MDSVLLGENVGIGVGVGLGVVGVVGVGCFMLEKLLLLLLYVLRSVVSDNVISVCLVLKVLLIILNVF